jgi:hypothetical protein
MKLLKGDHGMTHGFANLVALKPIYDALIAVANSCGAIEVAPKKAWSNA